MQPISCLPTSVTSKIAEVCTNLRPFQAVEYDPSTGHLSVTTEWLIPTTQVQQLVEILGRRKEDEKVSVRRFDQNFKVAMEKSVQL